jgi:hypothetical protein
VDSLASPEAAIAALPHETMIVRGREDQVVPLANWYAPFELISGAQLHVFGHAGTGPRSSMRCALTAWWATFLPMAKAPDHGAWANDTVWSN